MLHPHLLLEVEPQSRLDLTWVTGTAGLSEEGGGHRAAVTVELRIVQQVLDLELECYRLSVVILIEIAVLLTAVASVREVAAVAALPAFAAIALLAAEVPAITLAAEVATAAGETAAATALRFDEVVNRIGTAGAGAIR